MTKEQVEAIHQASLRILDETGITLIEPEGRAILLDSGAYMEGDRIHLPPELVERLLEHCPPLVQLQGRSLSIINLGDGNLHWHNLGGARLVYGGVDGTQRPALIQDVRDSTRLLDALDGVSTITPFFTPQDVPGKVMSLAMYRYALPHTTKPLHGQGVQNEIEVGYAIRMAEVIGPPSNFLSLSVSPVSPLSFPNEAVKAILAIARAGIPFAPLPCPTAGTTAPFSLAGAVSQQNAEVLASLVLAQIVHPGLPIMYCGRLAMMEPRSGFSVWGGVELGLASAATVQIAHRYQLPVNVYGFSTNANTLDVQNGFERALNAAIPALAGADELSGIGEMYAGVAGSYAQMVVDNELAASVRRLRNGFITDQDSLAVEVIASALIGAGNFLGQKHTSRYLRSGEVLITHLAERRSREAWENDDKKGMVERAADEARQLIDGHQVTPLDDLQERELDIILSSAIDAMVD